MATITNHLPTETLQALDAAHHIHPFTHGNELDGKGARVITRADGVWLTDSDGNTYKAWALEIEDGDSNSFENVVGLMFQAGAVPPYDEDLTVTGFLDLFNLSSDNT